MSIAIRATRPTETIGAVRSKTLQALLMKSNGGLKEYRTGENGGWEGMPFEYIDIVISVSEVIS
jgi:hypothetical protein